MSGFDHCLGCLSDGTDEVSPPSAHAGVDQAECGVEAPAWRSGGSERRWKLPCFWQHACEPAAKRELCQKAIYASRGHFVDAPAFRATREQ